MWYGSGDWFEGFGLVDEARFLHLVPEGLQGSIAALGGHAARNVVANLTVLEDDGFEAADCATVVHFDLAFHRHRVTRTALRLVGVQVPVVAFLR